MSVYKSLTTSDVIVTPFKVNKSFSFQGASAITASNVGIDRFLGKNITYVSGSDTTGQIKTQSQALIYDSIKQLYYTNYLRGEDGSTVLTSSVLPDGIRIGQAGVQPMYENYLSNTLEANRIFPTGSGDTISVISIPSNLFGEYIKPGSFEFKYLQDASIITLTDNSEGKIISSSQEVGDIIYKQGNIILTNGDSIDHSSLTSTNNVTCSFQSTLTIYESQYKCTFSPNEYTYTQNPSAISGSADSGVVYDFLTGSYFQPYVTTVGLYNNANQLVAVGKLSQPLQSSNVTDTTILVNLDL
jgi:hypothetical protein